jgi:hypothetical protein
MDQVEQSLAYGEVAPVVPIISVTPPGFGVVGVEVALCAGA